MTEEKSRGRGERPVWTVGELKMRKQLDKLLRDAMTAEVHNSIDKADPSIKNKEKGVVSVNDIKNRCPNCGELISDPADEIGLLLTPPGSSPLKKSMAPEVMVIVCPNCRVLFFDNLNHMLLKKMRDSQ